MTDALYDEKFFAYHEQRSRESARETIPVLFEFVQPSSVIDVGCGIGTWLTEFKAAGVADYQGVDGDYVDRAMLVIEPERFMAHDLSLPLEIDRRFDLAVSLEVAEHLPAEAADAFVASLVRLAPAVMFSAAIPHQQGVGHVNERWPEYWHEKFKRHDYVVVDCLRRPLWQNVHIETWYRQNLLIFVERARLANYPRLQAAFDAAGPDPPLSLVHPGFYLQHHTALHEQVHEARCLAMRHALRLREISFVAFPDWARPIDELRRQLGELLAALVSHRDRERMTLVLHYGAQPRHWVDGLIREVTSAYPPELARLAGQGPSTSAIDDSLTPEHWKVLRDCVRWRATISGENQHAIAAAGAEAIPAISLAQILAGESLVRT
jgi:SAM-dependent methyltransferase